MTKPKNGKTKDLGTHILVCVLLCVSFLSIIGLAYETQTILTQKSQITNLEIRNLDLRGALILTELRIKWLKRQLQKLPKKRTPNPFGTEISYGTEYRTEGRERKEIWKRKLEST